MKTKKMIAFILATFCLGIAWADVELDITVIEDSKVSSFDGKSEIEVKANVPTKVTIPGPLILDSPSRVPTILVPVYAEKSSLKVSAPLMKDALEKVKQEEIGQLFAAIFPEVMSIQSAIRGKQIEKALKELGSLQTRFPNIKFLNFLKASIVFIQGNRAEAIRLTEETLKIYPEYSEGQKFLKEIRGAK